MIQETEDDRLDQSLRDTFSDFDLPPSSHVWAGIESHLSALPAPSRPLPLLLMLPIIGLVGVTIGWLLPRPATVSPAPRPTNEATTKTRLASLRSSLPRSAEAAYTIPRSSTEALASPRTSEPATAFIDKPVAKRMEAASAPKVKSRHSSSPPEFVASANTLTPIDSLPLRAVSSIESVAAPGESVVQAELPTISQVAPAVDQPLGRESIATPTARSGTAEVLGPTQREGLRERRPEYRVPTHRLAERGRGLRRIQNNFVRHWQHFFGPHRARVAAQPDF